MPLSGGRTLLKYLQTGICVVSRKGEVLYLNPAFMKLFNLEKEKPSTLSDIFGEEARRVSLWLENSRRHGGYFLEITRDDKYLRLMAYPIVENGKDLGWVVEVFHVKDWHKTAIMLKENVSSLKKKLNDFIKKEFPSLPDEKLQVAFREIENWCSMVVKSVGDREPELFDLQGILKEHVTLLTKSLQGTKIYKFIPSMLPPVFFHRGALNEYLGEIINFTREDVDPSRPVMVTAKPGDTENGLYNLISHAFFLSNGDEKISLSEEKLQNIVASYGGSVKILKAKGSICITVMIPSG